MRKGTLVLSVAVLTLLAACSSTKKEVKYEERFKNKDKTAYITRDEFFGEKYIIKKDENGKVKQKHKIKEVEDVCKDIMAASMEKDGKMTKKQKEECHKEKEKAFERMDINRDGMIHYEEYAKYKNYTPAAKVTKVK